MKTQTAKFRDINQLDTEVHDASAPKESAVRQKAHRRLYRLTKFRERSRWYNQHGPYALVNGQNLMEYSSLSLVEANEILDGMQPAKCGIDYFDVRPRRGELAARGRRAREAGAI